MHLDNLSRGAAQSRGPACRITEGHDCQAKRRRCGENRRGATFLKGCCRAATQRSVTLTNASCPVRVPGCVKTRLSQGRAELFSQLPSPNRSCQCNQLSTTTKSRQKFYAQVQRRSFHTAWVKLRRTQCDDVYSSRTLITPECLI